MKLEINKNSNIPLYKQIFMQIEEMIKNGELSNGDKLPSEKKLSAENNISLGTVKKAYESLEKKCYTRRTQGSGTFVLGLPDSTDEAEKLAHDMFSKIKFMDSNKIYEVFIKEINRKFSSNSKINMLWIDYCPENIKITTKQILEIPHLNVKPVLLEDLKKQKDLFKTNFDIAVIPALHYSDFLNHISKGSFYIEQVALAISESTVMEIAKIEDENKIGILYRSDNFLNDILKTLSELNKHNQSVFINHKKDFQSFFKFISHVKVLIVPPDYLKTLDDDKIEIINQFSRDGGKIIPFELLIDRGSLFRLKLKVDECYNRKFEKRENYEL